MIVHKMTNEELRAAIETLGAVPRGRLLIGNSEHVQKQLLNLIDEQVRRATLVEVIED